MVLARLEQLESRLEHWLRKLDERQRLLAEAATLAFERNAMESSEESRQPPGNRNAERARLALDKRIAQLRGEAEEIVRGVREFLIQAAELLLAGARQHPELLDLATQARTLTLGSVRDSSAWKLRLLECRRLLREAVRGVAHAPVSSPQQQAAPTASEQQEVLSVDQVARRLGVSAKTIYRLVREGRIPYLRVGRSLRFRAPQIQSWIEACSFDPARRSRRS